MKLLNVILAVIVFCSFSAGRLPGQEVAEKAKPLPVNGLLEISFISPDEYDNPFTEATVEAVLKSPQGKEARVSGFFHGKNEWRVRFVPREIGSWEYTAYFKGKTPQTQKGTFVCEDKERPGFLRISKRNPFRLEYEDGKPFYPIGVQTGGYTQMGFDGPAEGRWRSATMEEWCEAFEGAVNLVRWQLGTGTQAGCALALIPKGGGPDRYDTELAAEMDRLLVLQREHGISHIMILFQDMSLWGSSPTVFGNGRDLEEYKSVKAKNLPLQEAYLRYVVARFGCYVDIWELFNEDSYAPDDYLAHLAKVIREADPYKHPITTNYARPRAEWCEIVTWHEYMGMPVEKVDAYVAKEIGKFKSYGKVVMNTEFGNQGWLSNHDPIKWRIATWTAFMSESSILFWSTSGRISKGGRPYRGNANAYLGPESRTYFRSLHSFTKDLPIDMRPVASGYTEHNDIRTYALSNGKVSALYIHHFSDHSKSYQNPEEFFIQTGPGSFKVTWINPADGKTVHTEDMSTKEQYLKFKKIPPVTIDLACKIEREDPKGN
ncbi:DUF5060 domain-containing protein [Planctomycetota bacterium]